jgi:hypothetical protein
MRRIEPRALDAAFTAYLQSCGYIEIRDLGDGRWAGLMRFMFTSAIITGSIGDLYGYDDRWCYQSMAVALAALTAWNGTGEPAGWHRHPATGRRVSAEGEEYFMP